ncbi:unnamed protein product [Symbiodinium sp. CCMP2456]|nr:unnamed protein product [Symbiodinium sp. CCMP2456]
MLSVSLLFTSLALASALENSTDASCLLAAAHRNKQTSARAALRDPSDPSGPVSEDFDEIQENYTDQAVEATQENEENYMDRWAQKWMEQSMWNLGKEFLALMLKTAITGVLGDVVAAFVKAFWPPQVQKEKRMMEIIMQWTKKYVDAQFAENLREEVSALLETSTRDLLQDFYVPCIEKLKKEAEKAWWFPQDTFVQCLGHLTHGALPPALTARNRVSGSKWRGGNIPTYLMAASVVMTLYHEYYTAMVFRETWKRSPFAELPDAESNVSQSDDALQWTHTSKEIIKLMQDQYDRVSEELEGMVKEWQAWRADRISYKETRKCEPGTHRSGYDCWCAIQLEDQHRDGPLKFDTKPKLVEDCWLDKEGRKELLQGRVETMYNQNTFALELVPMLRTFTSLHRLIPGREKEPLLPGRVLPKTLVIGTVSTWLTLSWSMHGDTVDRWSYADKGPPKQDGSIRRIRSREGTILDQLIVEYDDSYRKYKTVELPPGA